MSEQINLGLGTLMEMIVTGKAEEGMVTFTHKRYGDFEIVIRRPTVTEVKKKKK